MSGTALDRKALDKHPLHGQAGERLAKEFGPVGFLAREIAGEIPALLPG